MTTRAERKQARRELADWFRANALTPNGEAWRVATETGERDPDTLRRLNAAEDRLPKRLPDGSVLPAGLHTGDTLGDGSRVVCPPVTDPETGEVWVTTDQAGVHQDTAYPAGVPLPGVTRAPRTAPAWVAEASAEYRSARDAWEAMRESGAIVPTSVPGTAGGQCAMYQLSPAEYAEHVPAPRYTDFLVEYAARLREPEEDNQPAPSA